LSLNFWGIILFKCAAIYPEVNTLIDKCDGTRDKCDESKFLCKIFAISSVFSLIDDIKLMHEQIYLIDF